MFSTPSITPTVDLLQMLLNAVPNPLFLINRKHYLVMVNDAFCEMAGRPREELVNHADYPVPEDQKAEYFRVDDEVFSTGRSHENEELATTADGKVHIILTRKRLIHLTTDTGEEPFILASTTDVTRFRESEALTKSLNEELHMINNNLQQEVIEASTLEQERIGRELHDDLGQQLAALDLLAGNLTSQLQKKGIPELTIANSIKDNIQLALTKLRAIARGLAPVELESCGLHSALEQLVAGYDGVNGTSCVFSMRRALVVDSDLTATHLYRIAQEALNNAFRHAHAKHIEVGLKRTEEGIVMQVCDDGVGLSPPKKNKPGLGLHIMKYRADLIGATFDISSPAGKGTCISCTIKAN